MFASIGSLTGFFISGVVCFLRKWFWLNTLLAFIAFWLVNNFVLTQIGLSTLIIKLGNAVGNLYGYFGILVLLMLGISLFLFFAKPVTRFIEGERGDELVGTMGNEIKNSPDGYRDQKFSTLKPLNF